MLPGFTALTQSMETPEDEMNGAEIKKVEGFACLTVSYRHVGLGTAEGTFLERSFTGEY